MVQLCKKPVAMQRIHHISGVLLAAFIGLHLFNHACSIFGAGQHIATMTTLRHFYRQPFVEALLLASVFAQVVSGIFLLKKARRTAHTPYEKMQVWTGIYLAGFLAVHLTAVLAGRMYLHLDTNFYFGVAGLNTFPFAFFFIPYYALAIVSVFGHAASVHGKRMQKPLLGVTPQGQAKAILLFGIGLTILIFCGLTNRFTGVKIPTQYKVLIGR